MRLWLAWLALISALLGSPIAAAAQTSPVSPIDFLPALKGGYFRLDSQAVGRSFHIFIRLPEKYEAASADRFPVVYVLDGDSLFPVLATTHLFLHYDEQLADAVVVGIAYGAFDPATNKRDIDFTGPGADVPAERAGAPAFQRFLKEELLPTVESRYRIDPQRRVLFGQSRGGSFVLYSAFTDPDLFWGRIASNPAFQPGRERYFGRPAAGSRKDLGLVVVSGSRDRPALRADALSWFSTWNGRADAPWALRTVSLDGGTHAADMGNAYRAGMLWLFNRGSHR